MPRWVGYALYPLHLVVLIALEAALAQPIHTENLINAWNAFVSLFDEVTYGSFSHHP